MPLPVNIQTITLTGTFLDSNGAALSGSVTFAPPPELVDPANAILYATPVTATLDVSGHFSVTLICTDNSALIPVGWSYTVTENVRGTRSYPVYLPHTLGSTVDLSSVVPVPALDGTIAVIPSGVVAPGYGGLAYPNTWSATNTFTGSVVFSGAVSGIPALFPTTVKTSAYTAAVGNYVPVDASGGTVPVSLPIAPADHSVVGVKLVATASGHTATISTGGSDVLNTAGGPTSTTLTLTGQAALFQYSATGAIWYETSGDLPLAQLDTRYPAVANAMDLSTPQSAAGLKTFTGGIAVPTTATINANGVTSWFNVKRYGAKGDGATDDTAAINAAHSAARAAGGAVYFPASSGAYMLTPVSSTTAAVVWNNGTTGDKGVRWVGDSSQAVQIKRVSAGPLLAMAGPATDLTGATHCRYCSLENLTLDGNNTTGLLVQNYYADNLYFRDVRFQNANDAAVQSAEFWDSRFVNCVFDSNGSTTPNTTAPAVWLCNTVAASGFGTSTDVVNQIYFWGCRWENNRSGALRIERGPGGGTGQPTSIFLSDCKMESTSINGGNFFYVDSNSQFIDAQHLYLYAGGFYSGYSTAQDVVSFSPQVGSLRDIRIFNASAVACIASGITVNSPLSTGLVSLENVRGKYTTAPTGAHLNYGGTNTGPYKIWGVTSDNGAQTGGALPTLALANAPLNLVSGAVSDGSFATTPADGTMAIDTLNKRAYLRHSSGTWSRLPLNTPATSITSTTTIVSSNTLSTLQSASIAAGEPQTGSIYMMEGYGTYSVTGTPTLAFTAYWGTTSGTAISSIAAITAASGIATAGFLYRLYLTFRSTTSVTCYIDLMVVTNTSTNALSPYLGIPSNPTTVTTTGANTLTMGFQWSAASSSNTISLLGGLTSKLN